MTTSDRLKRPVDKFYELYNAQTMYEDPEFQPGSKSLYWASMGESESSMAQLERQENIEWKRASQVFPEASLFGKNGVRPEDMVQGFIGNCWFISGVAALAEFPGRIEKLFLNNKNELSPTGIYGINIYTFGFP